MPNKGSKVSETTKQKMRESWKQRDPHPCLTGKYGISEETIRAEFASGKRWCGKCKAFLESALFGKSKHRCKACQSRFNKENYSRHREEKLQRRKDYYWANLESEKRKRKDEQFARYGASREWYEAKLAEQFGGCAICGVDKPDLRSKFFFVDHRHGCSCHGKACDKCRRGLLCNRCNNALERMETVADWHYMALQYLTNYGGSLIGA
jgi:transposase-like protein